MKVEEFKDYTSDYTKVEKRIGLLNKLPDKRISDISSVLLVNYVDGLCAVKIRPGYEDRIQTEEFIVISALNYKGLDDWKERVQKTCELIEPGAFVIYDAMI